MDVHLSRGSGDAGAARGQRTGPKVMDEQIADVFSTLSQRRQVNVDGVVEALVERFLEATRSDGLLEIGVGGGDDSDVDFAL